MEVKLIAMLAALSCASMSTSIEISKERATMITTVERAVVPKFPTKDDIIFTVICQVPDMYTKKYTHIDTCQVTILDYEQGKSTDKHQKQVVREYGPGKPAARPGDHTSNYCRFPIDTNELQFHVGDRKWITVNCRMTFKACAEDDPRLNSDFFRRRRHTAATHIEEKRKVVRETIVEVTDTVDTCPSHCIPKPADWKDPAGTGAGQEDLTLREGGADNGQGEGTNGTNTGEEDPGIGCPAEEPQPADEGSATTPDGVGERGGVAEPGTGGASTAAPSAEPPVAPETGTAKPATSTGHELNACFSKPTTKEYAATAKKLFLDVDNKVRHMNIITSSKYHKVTAKQGEDGSDLQKVNNADTRYTMQALEDCVTRCSPNNNIAKTFLVELKPTAAKAGGCHTTFDAGQLTGIAEKKHGWTCKTDKTKVFGFQGFSSDLYVQLHGSRHDQAPEPKQG